MLITLASYPHETFKGSTIAEKRELLNFIFSNLTLEGCKLHYVLAFPFTELQKVANCSELADRVGFEPTVRLPVR